MTGHQILIRQGYTPVYDWMTPESPQGVWQSPDGRRVMLDSTGRIFNGRQLVTARGSVFSDRCATLRAWTASWGE